MTYKQLQDFYKSTKDEKIVEKSGGLKELAAFGVGLTISDLIVDSGTGKKRARESQQAEFERHVDRSQKRRMKKSSDTLDVLNAFLRDHSLLPPRQGLQWDAVKHRWTSPDKVGKTVIEVQGKKRIRGSGTGVHERSVGGHGKGSVRSQQAGRKFRSAEDSSTREEFKEAGSKKRSSNAGPHKKRKKE